MSAAVFTPGHAVRLLDAVPGTWRVIHRRECWLVGFWAPRPFWRGYLERKA